MTMTKDDIAKRAIDLTVKGAMEHYKQKGEQRTETSVRKEIEAIANKTYREKGAKLYKD